ncbi:hypothetical protein DB30_04928 [Enhygromyxa salina]|uniref:Polyketide cyclase / dehydrase and lipid transport n=1 Tax=Enhygromyxa salina TaxID=215803 RepID=A0A0C2CYI8_9BACT|nr:SRPBCC domain-containing protein [Enhygromyxa salina]KIG16056.1 hypothetical protein DB30_04928 [Enhygromyxa salina]
MLRQRVRTSIVIAAPPAQVWDALIDIDSYPRWNPVLSLRPWRGDLLRAGHRAWLSLKPFPVPVVMPVRVEVVEPGRELCWSGGPWGVLRGRHGFELRDRGAETEVIHSERFDGLLVPLLWSRMEPELERLYGGVNTALADYVEGGATATWKRGE